MGIRERGIARQKRVRAERGRIRAERGQSRARQRSRPGWTSDTGILIGALAFTALAAVILAVVQQGIGSGAAPASRESAAEQAGLSLSGPVHPFDVDLPYEDVLEPLVDLRRSGNLEQPAFQRFEGAVWSIHQAALDHTAGRLGLSRSEKRQALRRAEKTRQGTAKSYYDDYRSMMESSEQIPDGISRFSYEMSGAAKGFSAILAKRLCDVTIFALEVSTDKNMAGVSLLSLPCGLVMKEVLLPVTEEMEQRALLQDYVVGREAITDHLRSSVVEMATAKDEFSIILRETFTREIFGFTSEAKVRVTLAAKVKAGFDLGHLFSYEINSATREFIVTLPEPELLSTEVQPDIDKMEDGWFVEIDERKLNAVLADGRRRASQRAESTGLLEKARENAEVVVRQLFAPLANTPRASYGVRVEFQTDPLEIGGLENRS